MTNNAATEPSQETASLVKRLAGPSTTKAGLAKDQSETNRIIADASKGSAFYENEKRKDKDLTERIARILKQRDEALKGVDLRKVEERADHILTSLEAERDLSQYIVHVDMDAFYANVELLEKPELAGKPFGVGGGVLTTASYEARKFGVRSGMPGFIAQKLCPELILIPITMGKYSKMSKRVMSVFRQYDPEMLAASVDEGYLNITSYCQEHNIGPDECVRKMRQQVVDETRLTVSAGIAVNKMLAKICSDKNKPNGQFHLPHERDAIVEFMRDLSIRKIPGIGRVNERLLDSIGIKTCGDIYTYRGVLSLMDKQFGLKFLLRTHLGIASNTVQPWAREDRKSIGAERTFHPISGKENIYEKLDDVAEELESDMESGGWTGRTVTLKYKLDTYQVFTRAKSLDRWVTKKSDLLAIGRELLKPEFPLCIRLIGLRVTKLKDLRKKDEVAGIKRFFAAGGSPTKRQKIEHYSVDGGDDHYPSVPKGQQQDEDEEFMPGYHEQDQGHDVWDVDAQAYINEFDRQIDHPASGSRPRPPASAPAPGSSRTIVVPPRKPVSSASGSQPSISEWQNGVSIVAGPSSGPAADVPQPTKPESAPADVSQLACPICDQTCTDNDALNTHVDWCLSREAIRTAAAEGDHGQVKSKERAKHLGREKDDDGRKEWWKTGGTASNKGKTRKSSKPRKKG